MDAAAVPSYEPDVIERFAARLEARARALVRGVTVTGVAFGALVGAVPLSPLADAWPIPSIYGVATMLGGALAGGLIGYVVGSGRADLHRLHAQNVLCQLHAQRATLAIWRLLREREQAQVDAVMPPAPLAAPGLTAVPTVTAPPLSAP